MEMFQLPTKASIKMTQNYILVCNFISNLSDLSHFCQITGLTHYQLEKVALDGSVECCAPPPRWCDLEL